MPSLSQGLRIVAIASVLAFARNVMAFPINDSYYGGQDHGYGDIVGAPVFDVLGASVTRSGTQLTVNIYTNFAGHADVIVPDIHAIRLAS